MGETVGEAKKRAFDERVAQCKALTGAHCFPEFGRVRGDQRPDPPTSPIPGSLRKCNHCGLEERLLWGTEAT